MSATHRALLKAANTFCFLLMATVNALSVLLPIGGVTPAQVSARYENLLTPAGYVFSIWGVIYLGLLAFVLYQFGLFRTGDHNDAVERVGFYFMLSCLLNGLWIFAWHYDAIPLSMALIAALLLALARALQQLDAKPLRGASWALARLPLGLYFGWVLVAALLNAAALMTAWRFTGWGIDPAIWTVVVLALGLVAGAAATLRNRDPACGLAVAWGCGGVLVQHLSAAGYGGRYPLVIATAVVCLVNLCAAAVIAALALRRTSGRGPGGKDLQYGA